MNDLININVDYKYINDTENTVAFKTFRNSISSEEEYTNPSDNSQKLGNFKQTETALINTNTNFATIKTAVDTLEGEVTALSDDVSTYLGQSQAFNCIAELQTVSTPVVNLYKMIIPTSFSQRPQEGSVLYLQVSAMNTIAINGKGAPCQIELTVPTIDGTATETVTYGLENPSLTKYDSGTNLELYTLKPGKIYTFVLRGNYFYNVESKISKRLTGTFSLLGDFKDVGTYGNSWATDGSMLYLNLVLAQNNLTVASSNPVTVASLNNASYLSNVITEWFPASARVGGSRNSQLVYVRCQINNGNLICVAPGTTTSATTLNYLMFNVALPLPDSMGIF